MATWFELPDEPIRFTAHGQWLQGEDPLHPRVADLFSRHVIIDDEGHYRVQLGHQSAQVHVDDTPFVVTSIADPKAEGGALEKVVMKTSDGQEEELDPTTLMQSEDNVLYCRLERQGYMVPARFAQQQYHQLALKAEMADGQAFVPIAGERYPIKPYDARPHKVQ